MRSSWKTLVAAVASALAIPQLAAADDVQEQLRSMQERMQQLEDNLQATNDQLEQANERVEDQQQVIERAGLEDERSGLSALSKFLNETEFNGHVAASYTWNFDNPDNLATYPASRALGTGSSGENNGGVLAPAAPFHPFHNNFQVDQVWFGMKKNPTAESRGGFGVDVVYGMSADNQTTDPLTFAVGSDGNEAFLHQAYAAWLAPVAIGNGLLVKGGRLETFLGAEYFNQLANFNITRGLVWSLQPVEHTGVQVSTDLGDGLFAALAVQNDVTGTNVDFNNQKGFMSRFGWAGDKASVALNGYFGKGETGFAGLPTAQGVNSDEGLLTYADLVGTYEPTDHLSLWLNFDWIHQRADGVPTFNVYATAVAGRLALSESTGVATRFEYLVGTSICGGAPGLLGCSGGTDNAQQMSITLTLDHHLTESLMLRGEYRYDYSDADGSATNDFYVGDSFAFPAVGNDFGKNDQHLALVEMSYAF